MVHFGLGSGVEERWQIVEGGLVMLGLSLIMFTGFICVIWFAVSEVYGLGCVN